MADATNVGDLVAAFLEACGLTTAFGVISIHNMPVLDAIARRGRIRFVPARGEAGALNMADAFARVSGGLGVGVTSTGVAAGNAAGSLVEALTAGSPVLHLTGQIERPYLDRGQAYIHEAPDQPNMLKAISKRFYRVWSPDAALGILREAVKTALTPPTGPVSVEIPIDVQKSQVEMPDNLAPLPVAVAPPPKAALDALATRVAEAKRPLLWLGGGARHAGPAVARLVDLGFGVVTSVNGRGVVPEDHPQTLGAYTMVPPVEAFYKTCDLMIAVGTRLRGNETLTYTLSLPEPLYRIDIDAAMDGRSYRNGAFIQGDSLAVLNGLADRLVGRLQADNSFATELAAARRKAEAGLRDALGPYARFADQVQEQMPPDAPWVRDITLSNSTWGNRYLKLSSPRNGVHGLGGGIGQGLPMAIGAALAANGKKTVALIGDGGFMVNPGELATAAQERAEIVFLLMNDGGYGVIRNIQDAQYGGRHNYADLLTPEFATLARSCSVAHWHVADLDAFPEAMAAALAVDGPAMIEIDMVAIGPFAKPFAGPPVRPGQKSAKP